LPVRRPDEVAEKSALTMAPGGNAANTGRFDCQELAQILEGSLP
jgi:hypothetical protein